MKAAHYSDLFDHNSRTIAHFEAKARANTILVARPHSLLLNGQSAWAANFPLSLLSLTFILHLQGECTLNTELGNALNAEMPTLDEKTPQIVAGLKILNNLIDFR